MHYDEDCIHCGEELTPYNCTTPVNRGLCDDCRNLPAEERLTTYGTEAESIKERFAGLGWMFGNRL